MKNLSDIKLWLLNHPKRLQALFLYGGGLLLILLHIPFLFHPVIFDSQAILNDLNAPYKGWRFAGWGFFMEPRQVTWLIWGTAVRLFGVNLKILNGLNLVFHLANSFLIYFFIRSLLFQCFKEKKSLIYWCSFLGMMFFALNPVTLYATGYLAQFYTVLALFFSVVGLLFWIKGLQGKTWALYVAILFYALAIHSKIHVVLLPGIFILLVVLFDKIQIWKKLIPPLLLSGVLASQLVLAMKRVIAWRYEPGSYYAIQNLKQSANQHLVHVAEQGGELYFYSIFNQLWLFFRYFYLWLVPDVSQMALYSPQPFVYQWNAWPQVLGGILFVLLLGLSIFLLMKGRRFKILGFSLLVAPILFVTEFSTVRYHENFVLYRSYLWMFGLALLPGVFILSLPRRIRSPLGVFFLCYLGIFVWAVQNHTNTFSSKLDSWRHSAQSYNESESTPAGYMLFHNYGSVLSDHMQTEPAIQAYQKSVKLNPRYVKGWYGLGMAYYLKRDYPNSIQSFKKAIEVNPHFKPVYFSLGRSYLAAQDFENAIRHFYVASEHNPKSFNALYMLATAFLQNKQPQGAIRYFNRAVKRKPKDARAWDGLGVSYYMAKDYQKAFEAFKKAHQISPDLPDLSYNLGLTAMALNQLEDSETYLRQAVKKAPKSFKARYDLAALLMIRKKHKEASELFRQSVLLKPDDNRAWEQLGASLMMSGQWQKATEYLNERLKKDPNNKEIYYNLGTMYSQLNQIPKAIEAYLKAIELDREYVNAHFNLANAYSRIKEYSNAVKHLDAALKVDPLFTAAYHNLGIVQAQMNYHDKARKFYEKVIELEPKHKSVYFNLGNSLVGLNLYQEALQAYKKSIELNPGNIYALHNLGLVLLKLNRSKEASNYFAKAVRLDPNFGPSRRFLNKIEGHK